VVGHQHPSCGKSLDGRDPLPANCTPVLRKNS
jgi:hypothetical protein